MTLAERRFPTGMLATGRVVHRLLSAGLPLGPLYLLRTRGRRTGELREVPIAVLQIGDEQWLVSPFGTVAWVHNVRANGEAHLRRGAHLRRLHLVEVHDASVPRLLRAYRRRFGAVPFVRAAFHATTRDQIDASTPEVHDQPVFRIEETSTVRPTIGTHEQTTMGETE